MQLAPDMLAGGRWYDREHLPAGRLCGRRQDARGRNVRGLEVALVHEVWNEATVGPWTSWSRRRRLLLGRGLRFRPFHWLRPFDWLQLFLNEFLLWARSFPRRQAGQDEQCRRVLAQSLRASSNPVSTASLVQKSSCKRANKYFSVKPIRATEIAEDDENQQP